MEKQPQRELCPVRGAHATVDSESRVRRRVGMHAREVVMGIRPWVKISEESRIANKWWVYRRDRVRLPDGSESEYHSIETPGSVMIVPVDGEGRFVMVRQYRYVNERESLEFPGGGIIPGLTAEESAARELAEEAGCAADDMRVIGTHNPWNGVTGEWCTVFLARGLRPARAAGDPGEDCVVEYVLPEQFERLAAAGEIWDGMTLAAWALYRIAGFSCRGGVP